MSTNGLAIMTRMLLPYAVDTRCSVSDALVATAIWQEGHENAVSAKSETEASASQYLTRLL